MEVFSYQPHSRKYSSFPHDELLPTSKFRTSSSSNPISGQSSIPKQNKIADSVPQLQGIHCPRLQSIVSNVTLETDDVDRDESSDDELPSLRKLLSRTTHAPRNPSRPRSLNPSVQTAGSSAPTSLDATSAPRRTLFPNAPAWSFFHPSKYASRELKEPAVWPLVAPSRCALEASSERELTDGSVGGGHYISRGNSQGRLLTLIPL